jgi:hypothetical protein
MAAAVSTGYGPRRRLLTFYHCGSPQRSLLGIADEGTVVGWLAACLGVRGFVDLAVGRTGRVVDACARAQVAVS